MRTREVNEVRGLSVRIISATSARSTFTAVERMRRTNIANGFHAIDVSRFDEDPMSTNGTGFKGEVPVTHLVFVLSFGKREEATEKVDLRTVGGGRGYRRWAGKRGG